MQKKAVYLFLKIGNICNHSFPADKNSKFKKRLNRKEIFLPASL